MIKIHYLNTLCSKSYRDLGRIDASGSKHSQISSTSLAKSIGD